MKITDKHIYQAAQENIISDEQARDLVKYLTHLPDTSASFNFTYIFYYLGGAIATTAMIILLHLGWNLGGGWGVLGICLLYAIIGLVLATRCQRAGFDTAASLCAVFIVTLTPPAVYGIQQILSLWPEIGIAAYNSRIQWLWLTIEISALAVGLAILWRYRYSLLMLPIAICIWYVFIDTVLLFYAENSDFITRALASIYCGLLLISLALFINIKIHTKQDYAFWLYICGVIFFWGGLTVQHSGGEWSKFLYCIINIAMLGVGVLLARRIFVILGAIGICIYIGYLAAEVFENSWAFAIILIAIGFAMILLGVWWQKNETVLAKKCRRLLPHSWQNFLNVN